jgi:hypothetical protein
VPILLLRRRTPQVWFFIFLAALTLLYALACEYAAVPGCSI